MSQPDWVETTQNLEKTIELISNQKSQWNKLTDEYKYLWHRENRPYSLEVNLRKFKRIDDDLTEILVNLRLAKSDLEKSYYLPSPLQVRLDIRELKEDFFQTWLLCGRTPGAGNGTV